MGKRRNNYIDIVKGVAIILVVIGHCFQFGTGNTNFETGAFFSNPVFNSDNTIFYTLFVDAYRFLTALSGCIFILVLLWKLHQMIKGHAIAKTIMFFSKISLCIYIVNHYTNEPVLLNLPIETLNYTYIAIETVCVLMLSYLFYYAFNSTKLTRFMFLGGRGK